MKISKSSRYAESSTVFTAASRLVQLLRKGMVVASATCAFLSVAHAAPSVQVVANASITTNELPLASLRAIFSMRVRNWPDGKPVTVFVLPDRDERHVAFSKEILYVYPYVLRDTWDRMVFTGTGKAPIEVKSEDELLKRVAATPGAIGYIPKGKVANEKIKILEIR